MKLGTKSLLYGAHAFWLHPWFVAWAWWKLYGFPWDPRLWVAFIVHDWGYWGLDKMDDDIGESHPVTGALIMHRLFDPWMRRRVGAGVYWLQTPRSMETFTAWHDEEVLVPTWNWYLFVFLHSRFLSKRNNREPSRLCYADKLAIALTPWWIYLPMVRLTGEIREYQRAVKHVEDIGFAFKGNTWHEDRAWFSLLQQRMIDFVRHNARGSRIEKSEISSPQSQEIRAKQKIDQ